MVIEHASCINIVCSKMIDRFGQTIVNHPQPHEISWIDNTNQAIEQRCLVLIDFNAYKANVRCDVVTMNVGYVLLGWPWLRGNDMLYDNHSNLYRFNHKGMKIMLFISNPKPKPIEPSCQRLTRQALWASLVSSTTNVAPGKSYDRVLFFIPSPQFPESKND